MGVGGPQEAVKVGEEGLPRVRPGEKRYGENWEKESGLYLFEFSVVTPSCCIMKC